MKMMRVMRVQGIVLDFMRMPKVEFLRE